MVGEGPVWEGVVSRGQALFVVVIAQHVHVITQLWRIGSGRA